MVLRSLSTCGIVYVVEMEVRTSARFVCETCMRIST